jgi:hypothetical protein
MILIRIRSSLREVAWRAWVGVSGIGYLGFAAGRIGSGSGWTGNEPGSKNRYAEVDSIRSKRVASTDGMNFGATRTRQLQLHPTRNKRRRNGGHTASQVQPLVPSPLYSHLGKDTNDLQLH